MSRLQDYFIFAYFLKIQIKSWIITRFLVVHDDHEIFFFVFWYFQNVWYLFRNYMQFNINYYYNLKLFYFFNNNNYASILLRILLKNYLLSVSNSICIHHQYFILKAFKPPIIMTRIFFKIKLLTIT